MILMPAYHCHFYVMHFPIAKTFVPTGAAHEAFFVLPPLDMFYYIAKMQFLEAFLQEIVRQNATKISS